MNPNFIISILRQILEFQKDGYTDFSFKVGNEQNPDKNSKLEECVLLDMNKEDKTKTIKFFNA